MQPKNSATNSAPAASPKMGSLEWSLLLILSILWGGSFFFSKIAVAQLPPFTVVLGRVGLAALTLNLIVLLRGSRMPYTWREWKPFFIMGAINNLIPFSLIFWGETQIPSGLASILNAATPVSTVILAHFLTQEEKLTPNRIAGILLGLLGVIIMIGLDAFRGLGLHILAELACLTATVSYAIAGIYGKRFKNTSPLTVATGQVSATTIMMIPLVILVDRPWSLPVPEGYVLGAILGLGILSTAVAYLIYFRILAAAGATNVQLVTFLIPVSALLLGILVLKEQLLPQHFLGMLLIGLGLAILDGRLLAAIRGKQ